MKAIEAFPISEEEARDLDELKKTFPDKSELRAVLEDYFHIYDDNASMEPQKFDMYFADFINDERVDDDENMSISNSRKSIKSAFKKGDKFENAYGATIVIDDSDANGRIQYVVRAGNSADCKSVDSDEKMQKILDQNGYIKSSFKSFCENKNMDSKECKKFLAWIRKNREDVGMNNNLSDDVLKKYYIQYLKTISNSIIKSTQLHENVKDYIQQMAEEDYNSGHPFDYDDFDEFKSICKDDGYDVTKKEWNLYWKVLENLPEESYDDKEELTSSKNGKKKLRDRIKEKLYSLGHDIPDEEYRALTEGIPVEDYEANELTPEFLKAIGLGNEESITSSLGPTEAQAFKETLIRAGYTEEQAQQILDQANQVEETQGEMMTSSCHGKQKKDTKNRSISSAKNVSIKSIRKK